MLSCWLEPLCQGVTEALIGKAEGMLLMLSLCWSGMVCNLCFLNLVTASQSRHVLVPARSVMRTVHGGVDSRKCDVVVWIRGSFILDAGACFRHIYVESGHINKSHSSLRRMEEGLGARAFLFWQSREASRVCAAWSLVLWTSSLVGTDLTRTELGAVLRAGGACPPSPEEEEEEGEREREKGL